MVPVKWRASLSHNRNCNKFNRTNRATEETSWGFHSIRIIKQFFLFDQYPPEDILQDLARLHDIKTAFQVLTEKEKKYLEDTYSRAVWCEHPMNAKSKSCQQRA